MIEVDLSDPAQVEHYWRVRETALSAGRPRYQPTRLEDFRELTALPDADYRRRVLGVMVRGSMIGAAMELTPLDPECSDVWVFPYVPPHYRGDGVGSMLMEELVAHASTHGRTRMLSAVEFAGDNLIEASRHPYVAFARTHGFEVGRRMIRWELALPVADDIADSFAQAAMQRAQGYRFALFEGLPPERWTARFREVRAAAEGADLARGLALQPEHMRGDDAAETAMWLAQGHRVVTAVALDPADELVAFSTVRVPPKPENAASFQGFTYVADAHRRHRLAPELLLSTMAWHHTHFPDREHVQTTTVEIDRKLASLYRAVGYQPIETALRVARRVSPPTEGDEKPAHR